MITMSNLPGTGRVDPWAKLHVYLTTHFPLYKRGLLTCSPTRFHCFSILDDMAMTRSNYQNEANLTMVDFFWGPGIIEQSAAIPESDVRNSGSKLTSHTVQSLSILPFCAQHTAQGHFIDSPVLMIKVALRVLYQRNQHVKTTAQKKGVFRGSLHRMARSRGRKPLSCPTALCIATDRGSAPSSFQPRRIRTTAAPCRNRVPGKRL
jgi:hypothetical protein